MKNIVKNATRHLVSKAYETFAKGKKAISVISLPGDVWELENYVLSNRDFAYRFGTYYSLDMILVERDEVVYRRSLTGTHVGTPINVNAAYTINQYNVTYKNEVLNESHVKSCKSDNIFAWFDFCGNPTTENINLINTATGKNVTYIFTFNTAWRMDTNVDPELRHLASLGNKAIATQLHLNLLAEKLGLTLIWSFEYVANYAPMISVCFSNDVNVIADKSLNIMSVNESKKSKLTQRSNTPITKTVTVKRDLSAVYVDVKAKMNDDSVCAKHNVSVNTLAAVKAWITMGK
ncbi:hypothetical protein CCP3SC1AL1_3150002 [Gammaproteobacteria bacterium]